MAKLLDDARRLTVRHRHDNGHATKRPNARQKRLLGRRAIAPVYFEPINPHSTNQPMDLRANPTASRRSCGGMARGADRVRYAGLPLISGED